MCAVLLTPGVNPTAVIKYISYHNTQELEGKLALADQTPTVVLLAGDCMYAPVSMPLASKRP